MSRPKFLIIGFARHGKDTAAEMLRVRHGLTFASSSWFAAESVVRPYLASRGIEYGSIEDCYADRVNRRADWFDAIRAHNADDPARLARDLLEDADIYVGMRSAVEFEATRHLFDLVIWVDASGRGKPPEGRSSMSIAFDPASMYRLDNNGSLYDLALAVDEMMRCWKDAQEAIAN